jgi:ABC-2 type transport system ATP-binding protein
VLGLYRSLTVNENLAFSAQAYEVPLPALPRHPAQWPTACCGPSAGLASKACFPVGACASPEILVLDQPTSGVDTLAHAEPGTPSTNKQIRGGVLVSTHDVAEAEQCDRLLLLSRARLVAQGRQSRRRRFDHRFFVRTNQWVRVFALLNEVG